MAKYRWQRAIDRIDDTFSGSGDLSAIFTKLDSALAAGFAENFRNQVDENGVAWPQHSPATTRRYGKHPLLILSGRMRKAAVDTKDPEHLMVRIGDTLITGIYGSVRYAIYHRTGTSKMPRRNVIYASPKTLATCEDVIIRGIKRMIRV